MKNVLIVYAHAQETSFNAALRQTAERVLREQGHTVVVSDLYAMDFNPVASAKDITGEPKNKDHFNYVYECGEACKEGRLAADIVAEQDKLRAADLVILQFPVQWMTMPAILKGWLDRVFTNNFAYNHINTGQKNYEQGGLKGKTALVSVTTGITEGFYTPASRNGDVNILFWGLLNGTLRFVGMDVLPLQVSWAPGLVDLVMRQDMLSAWEQRLQGVWGEQPIAFPTGDQFQLVDPSNILKGVNVKEDIASKSTTGLSPGTHLDKPIPPNFCVKK